MSILERIILPPLPDQPAIDLELAAWDEPLPVGAHIAASILVENAVSTGELNPLQRIIHRPIPPGGVIRQIVGTIVEAPREPIVCNNVPSAIAIRRQIDIVPAETIHNDTYLIRPDDPNTPLAILKESDVIEQDGYAYITQTVVRAA